MSSAALPASCSPFSRRCLRTRRGSARPVTGLCGSARVRRSAALRSTARCQRHSQRSSGAERSVPVRRPAWSGLPRPGRRSKSRTCVRIRAIWTASHWRLPLSNSPAFEHWWPCRCSRKTSWSASSAYIAGSFGPSPISRSLWSRASRARPSSPSRTRGCSTSCGNPWSSRLRPPRFCA